jgi:hypothetical protein
MERVMVDETEFDIMDEDDASRIEDDLMDWWFEEPVNPFSED